MCSFMLCLSMLYLSFLFCLSIFKTSCSFFFISLYFKQSRGWEAAVRSHEKRAELRLGHGGVYCTGRKEGERRNPGEHLGFGPMPTVVLARRIPAELHTRTTS